jgi:hypothetical protein
VGSGFSRIRSRCRQCPRTCGTPAGRQRALVVIRATRHRRGPDARRRASPLVGAGRGTTRRVGRARRRRQRVGDGGAARLPARRLGGARAARIAARARLAPTRRGLLVPRRTDACPRPPSAHRRGVQRQPPARSHRGSAGVRARQRVRSAPAAGAAAAR